MSMSDFAKLLGVCLTLIAGGMAWAFVSFAPKSDTVRLETIASRHVPAAEYEKHLKNEESRYVLELKKQIRELQKQVRANDPYAVEPLADLIATLCELRPNDKLCK